MDVLLGRAREMPIIIVSSVNGQVFRLRIGERPVIMQIGAAVCPKQFDLYLCREFLCQPKGKDVGLEIPLALPLVALRP